jgi:hypothetical protein
MIRYIISVIVALAAVNAWAEDTAPSVPASPSLAKDSRFFEMRTYHAAPGKLEALHARFRNFTTKIFTKHGMSMVAFWVPMDKDGKYENKLVYVLAFPSHEARDKAWKEFSDDLEWHAVKADSEKDGRLVEKVDSVYMTATDYSPIK